MHSCFVLNNRRKNSRLPIFHFKIYGKLLPFAIEAAASYAPLLSRHTLTIADPSP